MLAILLAVSVNVSNVTNVCPTCNGVGRVELPCPECQGKGQVVNVRKGKGSIYYGGSYVVKPCSRCSGKGLAGPRQKSSGKVDVKCPICNGRKKVSDEVLKAVLTGRKK